MPFPDDEKKRYADFAYQLITKDLDAIAIPPDTVLWHYTNGVALAAILESMTLFSTHISCLNDTTELRYGSVRFREALLVLRQEHANNEQVIGLIEGALNYCKEDFDLPVQARVPHYLTCFSEEKDDLSQWRAYGGGENGYAIGFRAADLWGCPNAILARINYDVNQHCGLAKQAARKMVELFIDGLRKCALADVIKFGEEFLTEWEKAITLVAPLVKDPAFRKERECRIVKGLMPDDLQTLKFIQKGSMMSRHLPLRPPGCNPANPYRLPIAEIMVGPSRHPQISRTSVDTLLRQKGFPAGLVSISKIPFQNT